MDVLIQYLMDSFGPFGIAFLMFLENVFPPIPSEVIMSLAGYKAATGEMSIITVIVAGSVGSLIGIMPWFALGWFFGKKRILRLAERYGRWMTMSTDDVEAADRWFRQYGYWAVSVGRLVPTVRTLISVPAGLSRMPFVLFMIVSATGTVIWTALLALAGFVLGQHFRDIETYVGPVSTAVVIAIVLLYLYRLATFKPSRRAPEAHEVDPTSRSD